MKFKRIAKRLEGGISGLAKKCFFWLPDKTYIKIRYFLCTGSKLNLRSPQTFNEKLQWLKLYDRKPRYMKMVDKYEVKKYISQILGEEYVVPTLGLYDKFEDIDFNKLPNQFVIKCTHDSGGLIICKDKSRFDLKKARKKINKSLRRNYYYGGREWPYKNIKPRIIIEKYMEDKQHKEIRDYKFFCFNGEPKYMYISEGLEDHSTARMCFFDMNYCIADVQRKDYRQFETSPEKPKNFEKMKELSRILSKDIPHIRADWYEINGKVYFGELTFFTKSGFVPFKTSEMDKKLGNMLTLPQERI